MGGSEMPSDTLSTNRLEAIDKLRAEVNDNYLERSRLSQVQVALLSALTRLRTGEDVETVDFWLKKERAKIVKPFVV
jgi:hypothetical protein